MIVSLSGIGSETLLTEFDLAGVKYIRELPPVGVMLNAGISIQIIDAIPWVSIATVIVAWLKYRPSRKITIINEKNELLRIEGLSAKELTSLLPSCKRIIAIETKKPSEAP